MLVLYSSNITAENLKEIRNLQGSWKFTIGDDPNWALPEYDDIQWDIVKVPGTWENSGYSGYNGYAWYRKTFRITNDANSKYLYLLAGYIDDVDEIYINGHLIGSSGIFPPLVQTAYATLRKYPVPVEILNLNGENLIAVRVFDDYLDGGITGGPVGFYFDIDNNLLDINLAGYWKFETVNKTNHSKKLVTHQNQGEIFVPGFWENWGYTNYDGAANYTTSFSIPQTLSNESIILVLGYIDDIDKVYLNDNLIGSVDMLMNRSDDKGSEYRKLRAYNIPLALIKFNQTNTIRVKVYDIGGPGGIYEGPVGITTIRKFEFIEANQKPRDWWEDFFQIFWD